MGLAPLRNSNQRDRQPTSALRSYVNMLSGVQICRVATG
jgi:hypothetical protein